MKAGSISVWFVNILTSQRHLNCPTWSNYTSSCNAASIIDISQVNEGLVAGSLSTALGLRAERPNVRRPADAINCRNQTEDCWGWPSITNLHKHWEDWRTQRHRLTLQTSFKVRMFSLYTFGRRG